MTKNWLGTYKYEKNSVYGMLEKMSMRTLPQKGSYLELQKKVNVVQQRKNHQYMIDGYAEFSTSSPIAS